MFHSHNDLHIEAPRYLLNFFFFFYISVSDSYEGVIFNFGNNSNQYIFAQ